ASRLASVSRFSTVVPLATGYSQPSEPTVGELEADVRAARVRRLRTLHVPSAHERVDCLPDTTLRSPQVPGGAELRAVEQARRKVARAERLLPAKGGLQVCLAVTPLGRPTPPVVGPPDRLQDYELEIDQLLRIRYASERDLVPERSLT